MDFDVEVALVGAGVVGCASALALARRGAAVALLEAEVEPGLAASGTNSGILHTGFDSVPGELETELILRSSSLRDPVLEALGVPVLRCGVLVFPTIDGKVMAGPTAVDQQDKDDWSVRPDAAAEILPKAARMWPPLEGARQVAEYVGLRPAGRGVNYLIRPSS